jgi:hypothetical protein
VPQLPEGCVLAITSKVISPVREAGRLARHHNEGGSRRTGERLASPEANAYGFHFTIAKDTLMPSAGIDESS